MLSRKEVRKQPQKAKEIKLGKSLLVIRDKVQDASDRLQQLMENTSTLHGSMQLNIAAGCMNDVTVACVYGWGQIDEHCWSNNVG